MKRYCFALDLKDDPELIAAYEQWHRPENIWPDIVATIREAGIENMEIYRTGNRLFMIMETNATFSFDKKTALDNSSETVQQWELLMDTFQQRLSWAKPGEKWVLMQQFFKLF